MSDLVSSDFSSTLAKAQKSPSSLPQMIEETTAFAQQAAEEKEKTREKYLAPIEAEKKKLDAVDTPQQSEKLLEQIQEWKPKQPDNDPIKAFGSWGSVFAMLASGLTKRPMVNALNAGAALINAQKQGDKEAYDRAFDAWKENSKLAIEKNDAMIKDWKAVNEKFSQDFNMAMAEADIHTKKWDDELGARMLHDNQMEKLSELNLRREEVGLRAKEVMATLEDRHTRNSLIEESFKDWQAANPGKPLTADTKAALYGGVVAKMSGKNDMLTTPTQIEGFEITQGAKKLVEEANAKGQQLSYEDALSQSYQRVLSDKANAGKEHLSADGKKLAAETYVRTGQIPSLGMSASDRVAVVNEAAQMLKTGDKSVGDVILARAGLKADEASLKAVSQKQDGIRINEATALDNMQKARNIIQQGATGGEYPILNEWIQAGRKATGNPLVKELDQALDIVANEVAKVNSGAVGNQAATDTSIAAAKANLSSINNIETLEGVFGIFNDDMQNRTAESQIQKDIILDRIGYGQGILPGSKAPEPIPPAATPAGAAPAANAPQTAPLSNIIRYDNQGNRLP